MNKFQSTINKPTLTVEEVAMGFVKVANETMCRPIRALTQVSCANFISKLSYNDRDLILFFLFNYSSNGEADDLIVI